MPSEEDYGSDYDAIPEAGRTKQQLDSDETSDDELSSSAPRRAPPFRDGDDDDDDDTPMLVEETRQDHSAASSTSSISTSTSATANPIIRRPTAFIAPNPATITSSSSAGGGPTFYGNSNSNSNKTPDHATVSADGTSMFCVEGYVNTPELSAGRGGGLSQGLPANGPYKSLFRARSESRGSNKLPVGAAAAGPVPSSAVTPASSAVAAMAPDAALHVLADAAQSPEAHSPVSAASPPTAAPGSTHAPPTSAAPLPTAKKPRKPSPLVASPPASSVPVEPLQSISAATTTTRPSPPSAVSTTTNASPPHVMDLDYNNSPPRPSPQVRPARPSRAGGTGKGGKRKEKAAPAPAAPRRRSSAQAAAAASVGGSDGRWYERRSVPPRQQPGQPAFPTTEHHEATDSAVPARPRSLQKNRARLEETGVSSVPTPPPPPAPAPANDGSYDHARGYYPAYYEIDPPDASNTAVHSVHDDRGQSLSSPPPKTWDSPRLSPSASNHYLTPASARTTSKESSPAFTTESRSQTQGPKPRMVTLFIEDRRHGTDELAEVHVPLRTIGEGYLWADARDVCAALQSGPSRIDGPAKVFTMRGKYRQIFLRISADGEETSQSANLKVETNKTLSIVVEGISDPRVGMPTQTFSSNPSPLVNPGPTASLSNTPHLLTPVSTHLDLDVIHATPPSHIEEWSGGARKRKRGTSLDRMQQLLFSSPRSRNLANTIDGSSATRTPHGQYTRPWKSRRSDPTSSFDGGYVSDSPPAAYRGQRAQRKDQIVSGSRMHVSGYETDQPTTSVRSRLSSGVMAAPDQHQGSDRRVSSLLQPPPAPVEGSQRMHDKVVAFLQESFMEDPSHWNEFTRDRSQVGSLSNAGLLRIYWFAQDRLDSWVGSRLAKHLNSKKVEIRDVLDALGITEGWYQECNETLSLVVAYGERGERGENARAVAACRDRAPKPHVGRVGPTDLLLLLRQVHEEYCERVRGRNGQGRDSRIE